MSYKYTATIYHDRTIEFRGQITMVTDSNAPSEEKKAIDMLLREYPVYIHMYGRPRVTSSHFFGYSHIGRKCGRWSEYRLAADLNRNERRMPELVFIDIRKEVI